ncbi:MAG: M20/M25/M40 family metallo-hydrolase [Desulfobacterales bacterium]|nr:M20/M25/M40 family metallo-hydrolase [Desulfobacterales bacterium]
MINKGRLAETFRSLVETDSISRQEGILAAALRKILESMGATVVMDSAGEKVGGDTGNLIAKFKGNVPCAPLLLNAHMDTVEPGRGIKATLNDGVFRSNGSTILGADDKSAIAILLEAVRVLQENSLPFGPLELVFTICEEIGLLGAKHLDFSLIEAKFGYALDATDTEGVITRAPSANRLEFSVHGKDAHAGAAPEKGINAIALASKAISGLTLGRIDRETTCNIGVIQGGVATNIVPGLVMVTGEVRSHDPEKLDALTNQIVGAFQKVVSDYDRSGAGDGLPRLESLVSRDFSRTNIPENHPVIRLARKAAANLGRKMTAKRTGGGADANIFFEKGIMVGVLGTGMRDMHTVRENVRLEDMVRAGELILEIIRLHQAQGAV